MSIDKFFSEVETPQWGLPVEIERRNRIRLSIAAYAYEFESDSIMSDGDFDSLAQSINIQISTKNDLLDNFFQEKFSTHTGQWVHDHPELDKLKKKYDTHYRNRK
jgi:hypothetical protein